VTEDAAAPCAAKWLHRPSTNRQAVTYKWLENGDEKRPSGLVEHQEKTLIILLELHYPSGPVAYNTCDSSVRQRSSPVCWTPTHWRSPSVFFGRCGNIEEGWQPDYHCHSWSILGFEDGRSDLTRNSKVPATWRSTWIGKIAERRVFPAININRSGTRREGVADQ